MSRYNNYKKFRNFYAPSLNKLSSICVQGESDKKNFEQLTTHKVQVMGNLKFDQIPPKETVQNSKKIKNDLMIKNWLSLSPDIIGGCCRVGFDNIKNMRKEIDKI